MSASEKTAPRRRRRDFEESREMILESAERAMTSSGRGISLKQIAEQAGVVTATLYRHFANREELERAVFVRRTQTYVAAIETATGSGSPDAAFRATIRAVVTLQAGDRFFREYVRDEIDDPFTDEELIGFYAPLMRAIETAREAGVLRDEVELLDVLVLLTTVEGVAGSISRVSEDALMRVVDFLLDGLCVERGAPQGAPLTHETLLEVVRD